MKKVGYVVVLALFLLAAYGYSHQASRGMHGGMMGRMPMMGPGGMGMMSEQMYRGCMQSMARMEGMSKFKTGMILNYADELELSDDQIEKIKALRNDFMKKNIELSSKIKIANLEKLEILSAKDIDEKKLSAKLDEIYELYKQMELNAIKFEKAVKAVLTKDQLKKLEKLDFDADDDDMPMMRRKGMMWRY